MNEGSILWEKDVNLLFLSKYDLWKRNAFSRSYKDAFLLECLSITCSQSLSPVVEIVKINFNKHNENLFSGEIIVQLEVKVLVLQLIAGPIREREELKLLT